MLTILLAPLTTFLAAILLAPVAQALPTDPSLWERYGLLGILFYLAYKEFWPWLRDRVYPDVAKARASEHHDDLRREDRLFAALDANTGVLTELRVTLTAMNETLKRQTAALSLLNADVANLYGHIGVQRPSRGGQQEPPRTGAL